jgi:hypothetical protein
VVGGGALWILGDLIGLPFLAAALIAMIREDEEEAAQVDAELDATERAAASGAAAVPAGGPVPGELARAAAEGRPWWESDPRFTGRFRGAEEDE